MFVKVGIKSAIIDIGEYIIKCPSCETDSWADVMVISNYWHIWFIPVFPVGKEATTICKKYGLKSNGVHFDEKLIRNFGKVKHLYRHPWYTYLLTGIIVIIILMIIIGQSYHLRIK
ncbi:MAG: hypothetical protein ABI402_14025 [Ferruginibacter sp.]